MTQSYEIRNLDCAACGVKIETAIRKLPGVSRAVVDFATLRLHLEATDLERVLAEIKRMEPAVDIIPTDEAVSGGPQSEKGFSPTRELVILIAALVLFGIHMVFEERIHQSGWPIMEYVIALAAYTLAGGNIYVNALRTLRKGQLFDENVLMVIATAGAIAIHAISEAVGVMIFYKLGEFLQNLAVSRSRRSIRSLLAARPDKANLLTSSGIRQVPAQQVNVGESIVVKPGERVPLDGEIISGESRLDSSALTGEPVPAKATVGGAVMAGMINLTGALTVRVSRPFNESSIAKVLELVQNAAARKAPTEKFITTFARYYTPAVVVTAAGIALIPTVFVAGASFQDWIYRALVVLVVSCPCALVVSIPLGYFGGIGRASHRGILVKGSNFIDALTGLKTVVFDKTGTLTQGVFEVREVASLNGFTRRELLEFAAAAEYHSNHPIAAAISAAYAREGGRINPARVKEHIEIPGKGVEARYGNYHILVGNDHLMHQASIGHQTCEFDATFAHIAVDETYAGYVTIGDQIKPDAKDAVTALREGGVEHIMMLTGDNACAAGIVSKQIGLDSFHANLLPEDKVRVLEGLSKVRNGKVAFVGDGINDAPVIARADVGVAMGALGSDAAIETADVVLMTDSPMKMAEAVTIAKQTRRIVWQNIILAFAVKGIFVTLGAIGMASMWEAVFADMGVSLAAVVNSTRMLRATRFS